MTEGSLSGVASAKTQDRSQTKDEGRVTIDESPVRPLGLARDRLRSGQAKATSIKHGTNHHSRDTKYERRATMQMDEEKTPSNGTCHLQLSALLIPKTGVKWSFMEINEPIESQKTLKEQLDKIDKELEHAITRNNPLQRSIP